MYYEPGHYLKNIIAIIIVGLIVFALIQLPKTRSYDDFSYNAEKTFKKITAFLSKKKQNIALDTNPTRRVPLTFIDRESKLREFLPDLFGNFNAQEWNEFWQIMYVPIEEEGLKRYRSKEEIESFLKGRYFEFFSNFKDGHWGQFWDLVKLGEA